MGGVRPGNGERGRPALTDLISADGPVVVAEPVVMEVVASARSLRREDELRRLLGQCHLLPVDPAPDFDAAARIHRRCRGAGVTPRGLIDCLIAAVAWRTGASVLARDVDLERVGGVIGLEVEHGSA